MRPPALHNFLTPIFNGLATRRPKWAKIIPLPPGTTASEMHDRGAGTPRYTTSLLSLTRRVWGGGIANARGIAGNFTLIKK